MVRYQVSRCVIDALPEIHATRAFAKGHPGQVFPEYDVEVSYRQAHAAEQGQAEAFR